MEAQFCLSVPLCTYDDDDNSIQSRLKQVLLDIQGSHKTIVPLGGGKLVAEPYLFSFKHCRFVHWFKHQCFRAVVKGPACIFLFFFVFYCFLKQ